jgi:hypothetical protein
MRYLEFKALNEDYKTVTVKFQQEDPAPSIEDIKAAMSQFKQMQQRFQGNEKNIDYWGKQGWQNFKSFIDAQSQRPTKSQQKKQVKSQRGRSITLDENDKWLIVIPLDKEASCFYGKDTDWCTTKQDHDYFDQYFFDDKTTLVYYLHKKTGAKWATASRYTSKGELDNEYFDKNDNHLDPEEFTQQTGIDPEKYIQRALGPSVQDTATGARGKIQQTRNNMKKLLKVARDTGTPNRELETLILNTKNVEVGEQYLDGITKGGTKQVELDQDMQLFVLARADQHIADISNITTKTLMKAANMYTDSLSSFKGVDIPFEVEKAAIDKNTMSVEYIPNASDEALEYAIDKDPDMIDSQVFIDQGTEKYAKLLQRATINAVGDKNEAHPDEILRWLQSIFSIQGANDETPVLIKHLWHYCRWISKYYADHNGTIAVNRYLQFLVRRRDFPEDTAKKLSKTLTD